MDTMSVMEHCYTHINNSFDSFKEDYRAFYAIVDKDEIIFIDRLFKDKTNIRYESPNDKMLNYAISTVMTATAILVEFMDRYGIFYEKKDIERIAKGYSIVFDTDVDFDNLSDDGTIDMLFGLLTDGIDLESRKKSGSERTPNEIISYMLDLMDYREESGISQLRIIDPSCGTGTFLAQILERYLNSLSIKDNAIERLVNDKAIVGFDTKQSNVYVSKIVMTCILIKRKIITEFEDVCRVVADLPIYCHDFLQSDIEADYIVGNPPYIRLQNLSEKAREFIKGNFVSATGRFDIYTCFIEKADKLLKENGRLCLITSNKYLTANYGQGIRRYLAEKEHVRKIIDLYDTKFFGAAVLPAITLCVNSGEDKRVDYVGIKSTVKTAESICNNQAELFDYVETLPSNHSTIIQYGTSETLNFEISTSIVDIPKGGKTWNFSAGNENELKTKLESRSVCQLKDMLDVCVGIKTTADTVFVKPMTDEYVNSAGFEKKVIYPLIQSFDVDRWKINWGQSKKDRYILYPHYEENGKMYAIPLEQIPVAAKYLEDNVNILKSREYLAESKKRQWYECWVPQKLSKFQRVKIVTRDIVSHNSFAMDVNKMLCQGNTFFLTKNDSPFSSRYSELSEIEFYSFLLGVLNSKVMEYYQKMISGCLYSQKYRYTTSNLNRWPIPDISVETAREISSLVINILDGREKQEYVEKLIDTIMYQAFGLSDDEIITINSFISESAEG